MPPCLQGRPHSHASLDKVTPPTPGQHTTSDSAESCDVQLMEVQTWIITEYCDQGALQVGLRAAVGLLLPLPSCVMGPTLAGRCPLG